MAVTCISPPHSWKIRVEFIVGSLYLRFLWSMDSNHRSCTAVVFIFENNLHISGCVSSHQVASVMSDSLWPCGLWPSRLLCPWDSPGKNTGVCCHALLQGLFRTQALNPHLMFPASAGSFFTASATWEACKWTNTVQTVVFQGSIILYKLFSN